MILIDPDLESDPTPSPISAKPPAGSVSASTFRDLRLPSIRTLARFLTEAQAAVRLSGCVTVLLTTDLALCDLNRRFRGKNKPTDVLSFPAANLPQSSRPAERDIAISVETARLQAIAQGHALSTELKVLILHGLLHLAGYNHESDAGQMDHREQALRARLGLPQGLIERSRTRGKKK
jgi:probable rRNA maturation factor